MAQKIVDVNENERKWIGETLKAAKDLIVGVLGPADDDWLSAANLDQTYSSWIAAHRRGVDDPNPIINALGIAFGQCLVAALDLEWKVVSDEYGTDLAVHGRRGDILVFPTNLVAKRYEKNEVAFFTPLFANLKDQIEKVRIASKR